MLKKNNYKIISLILFIAVIVFAGLYFTKFNLNIDEELCADSITTVSEFDEKAIVDVEVYDWGINELNMSQLIFDYWIYNYGNAEAKNLKIKCKLFNENDTLVDSFLDDFGNLASQSMQFSEFIPQKPSTVKMMEVYYPICYVESCDNCEILYKKIPDLVEIYGAN